MAISPHTIQMNGYIFSIYISLVISSDRIWSYPSGGMSGSVCRIYVINTSSQIFLQMPASWEYFSLIFCIHLDWKFKNSVLWRRIVSISMAVLNSSIQCSSSSCGRQLVNQFVCVSGLPLGPLTRFYLVFFRLTIPWFFFLRCPLWRENGSVVYNAITHWSK
jgi:hypothetical protein